MHLPRIGVAALAAALAVPLPTAAGGADRPTTKPALGLPQAVARTLDANPRLHGARRQVDVHRGEVTQAGLAANPTLDVEVMEFLGSGQLSGFRAAEVLARIDQRLQLGGKRQRAAAAAEAAEAAAVRRLDATEARLVAATTKAFVAALAARERTALADRFVHLAARNVSTVTDRHRAGLASEADLAKARLAHARTGLERAQARRAERGAYRQLGAQWAAVPPDFDRVAGSLTGPTPLPPLAELLNRLDGAPDLRAARAGVNTARAESDAAEAGRVPDLTVGVGAKYLNGPGDVGAVAGIGLPLPLFNRNQGERAAAAARTAVARAEVRHTRTRLATALADHHDRAAALAAELEQLRTAMLPEAKRAFAASRRLYERGRFSYLDLLDAQRTLFALERQRIDVLAAYHTNVAAIEGLLGRPLAGDGATETETAR